MPNALPPPGTRTRGRSAGGAARAFTLVELLVATAILITILVIILAVIGQTSAIWSRSSANIEAFQSARMGFDMMTRNLRQATLNTYLDYEVDPASLSPKRYLRKSDLRFLLGPAGTGDIPGVSGCGQGVFFQAPDNFTLDPANFGGLDALLNTCGYYVDFVQIPSIPQHVKADSPYRYRLIQMVVPTEDKNIYDASMKDNQTWFTTYTGKGGQVDGTTTRIVADNVIALILRPQTTGTAATDIVITGTSGNYTYDTALNATANPQPDWACQLPPMIQVTMVAIDESSAKRIISGSTPPPVITEALTGRFSDTAKYHSDLSGLEQQLTAAHIHYRIFSSAVPIRESLWTK